MSTEFTLKLVKTALIVTFYISFIGCENKSEQILPSDINPLNAFINNNNGLTPEEQLGKKLFFDQNLSDPNVQSCASCHSPMHGFSEPLHTSFSEGANKGNFGNRNTPMLGYLKYCPPLFYSTTDSTYVGGFFWDGRASTLAIQAHFPLNNPIEMNNKDTLDIVTKVANSGYSKAFNTLHGENAYDNKAVAYKNILNAIATYESSIQFRPFTSKYDFFLNDQAELSDQELRGLKLFNGEKAKCSQCHPSEEGDFGAVLFTDFTYDNIGLPKHPNSDKNIVDLGLANTTKSDDNNGQFKVPSLRNVEITAPYFHNGIFKTLEEAIRFYSERDIPGKYLPPEVPETVNRDELGNLELSDDEIADIAVFLKTLTDGYKP